MFYYKQEKEKYYIWSDKIKGKFGPFKGIFCKNKYLGKYIENKELEKKYPGYNFSFGFGNNSIFIINTNGIEKIIKMSTEGFNPLLFEKNN